MQGIRFLTHRKKNLMEVDTDIIPRGRKFRIKTGRLKTVGKGCIQTECKTNRFVYYQVIN